MKLTNKLMLIFLLLSIIPVILVGYMAYHHGERTIKQNTFDELTSINILKSNNLSDWLHNKQNTLQGFANNPFVMGNVTVLASQDQTPSEYAAIHKRLIEDYLAPAVQEAVTGFTELSVVRGSDGLVLASTNEKAEGESRKYERYFIEGQQTTYVESRYDSSTESSTMIIGTPVNDVAGNLIAVLAGRVNLDELSGIMAQASSLSQTQDTYLIDNFGGFVTAPRLSKGYILNKATRTEGTQTILESHENFVVAHGSYKNYRGVSVIGAYQWIPEWGWYIQTEIDQSEALKPIHDLRNIVIAIGGIVAVVVAVLALFFSRTITRPVRRLAKGVVEIGQGNMDYRVGTPSKDEIGSLSRAFDSMAEHLKTTTVSRDDLAEEVAERKRMGQEVRDKNERLEAQNEELRVIQEELNSGIEELAKARAYSDGLLSSITDSFIVIDIEGKVIDVNAAYLKMLGFAKKEEVVGLPALQMMSDIADPAEVEKASVSLQEIVAGRLAPHMEMTFTLKDGKTITTSNSTSMVRDAAGAPMLIFSVMRDITERKRAEEQLKESIELYSTMANSSQVGIYIVQDGQFVFVNPQFQKDSGFGADELLGKSSLEIVHPADKEMVRRKAIEALKSKSNSPYEYRVITKSGEIRVFLETVASIHYKGHRASIGNQMDITERKLAEENLKKSEERFRSVAETASDAIITADSDGNIVLSNRAAETIFGYSGEELAGKEIIQLMPDGFRGTFRKEMSLLISTTTTSASGKTVEATGIRKDGSKFPAELSRAAWWTQNGFFFTAIVRDITERKQMESKLDEYWAQLEQKLVELQLAYQQLKELDQMKDKFLSTVSHELRTPLTSIKSFAEILLNYEDDRETQKEFLGIINEECDRLTRLINDFLDLAKIEAGRMQWQDAELAVAQVIEKSLGATRGLVEKKHLIVTVDFEPDLPPVLADKDRLLQVVTNLLSNSIKFTPEGGKLQVGAGIVKKTGDTPEMIRVSVSDSGIGIAPEHHETIFEKFRQVGDTLRDKPQGTGLGLPICKEIVEHYNGRVWVESELGKGSTFYFTLPTVSKTEPEVTGEAKAGPASVSPRKGRTILVVDDEEHIRRFLSHELTKRGFQVFEASDGKEAIEKAREHRPALITLDVLMPGIDGFDVTAVLKNNPDTKDIPILIVSVMEDKEKAYRLGANDYLTKPFEIETLMAKITGLVQQPQKSILVVDDDRALTKSIKYELEKRGFSISVAYNGKQALEMVEVLTPDLILLDIMMPEMDGYEVIKALKINAITTNIPVVVMTGMEIDGGRVKVLSLGANEYIAKSGGLDKLYSVVDSILDLGSED
ncbi:MAG: PAS domain S-box protein [Dehalococcoidia bacterium]